MIFPIYLALSLLQFPVQLMSVESDDPNSPASNYDGSRIPVTNMTVKYGARAYGFFSIFDRRQPYVLFHTLNGVQMLTNADNISCYPSLPIIPYAPSEEKVKYAEVSPQDNYILTINANNVICTKHLIKSEWNNGIEYDLKRECREGTVGNGLFFALSVSRHVIYMLDHDGALSVVSLREGLHGQSTCTFAISKAQTDYAEGKVVDLHVTNYDDKNETDLVIISLNNSHQIHALGMNGEHKYTHNLTEGDQVVAVRSNKLMNIFVALNRKSTALVIMYPLGFISNPNESFFSSDNSQIVSLSVSNRVAAILVRQELQPLNETEANGTKVSTNFNFTLVIIRIDGTKDKEVWYRCVNATDLMGVIIVDESEAKIVRNVCEDKPEICNVSADDQPNCPNSVLQFKMVSPLLDHESVEREAAYKLYQMISFAMITLLSTILFLFTPSS